MDETIQPLRIPAASNKPADASNVAGLRAILDNLDALVYVSDMGSHELIYMNAYGRRIWGDTSGRKCWQVLQDSEGPCEFCTNHKLVDEQGQPTAPLVWEFQNRLDGRWYQCRDQAIRWTDGRLVRLEVATDITERKNMELALQAAHKEAKEAAMEDQLTGLHNRRAFFEFGNRLLQQSRRSEAPLALIMLDLDHFKQINDTYGHQIGDEVLRKVGEVIRLRTRESDISARIGGEEFALLLPEATTDEALDMADRLKGLMSESAVQTRDTLLTATASFGVAGLGPGDTDLDSLIARADAAMYRSKKDGRDQVRLGT
jgi:diguanylate cyclase (GGDEF)-like protein